MGKQLLNIPTRIFEQENYSGQIIVTTEANIQLNVDEPLQNFNFGRSLLVKYEIGINNEIPFTNTFTFFLTVN